MLGSNFFDAPLIWPRRMFHGFMYLEEVCGVHWHVLRCALAVCLLMACAGVADQDPCRTDSVMASSVD